VGKNTLAALNIPVEDRINQIRVNMERLRWIYHGIPDNFYGVDLAAFEIFYNNSNWLSPVQIGKTYHQTPVFHDVIRIVEINPTWTVPRSITRRELAPGLLQNPQEYLNTKNMELLTPGGEVVDPASVNWASISAQDFPYMLRQRSGPDNALGRIKFLFPNKHAVYLHDTPSRSLFEHPQRAFSHGCIRVEKPLELGVRLLQPNGSEWTLERIQQIIDSGKTTRIKLKKPVPILILYMTATIPRGDSRGPVQFRTDIYKRDTKVLKALDGLVKEKGSKLGRQHQQ